MKPRLRSESDINWFADRPSLWAEDIEDDDDVFMPSRTSKRAAASKGKRAATLKGKSGPSTESGGCLDGR